MNNPWRGLDTGAKNRSAAVCKNTTAAFSTIPNVTKVFTIPAKGYIVEICLVFQI